MQVPLEWKLSISGDNEIKSVMNDINSAFERGQISQEEYTNSLSQLSREAMRYNNVGAFQNRIFLAMHPNLNKLSRGLSTLASVTRTALSLITALNTVFTAQNTQSTAMAQALADVAEAQRGLSRSVPGSEEWQAYNEQLSIAKATLEELKKQENATMWSEWAIGIIAVVQAGNALIKVAPTIAANLGLISSSLALLGPIAAIIAEIVIGATFLAAIFGNKDAIAWVESMSWLFGTFTKAIDILIISLQHLADFLGEQIFNAVLAASVIFMKFFLEDLPAWALQGWQTVSDVFVTTWNNLMGFIESGINGALKGFASFVNKIIDGINKIIEGINKALGSNIPKIAPFVIDKVSLPRIDTGNTGAKSSPAIGTGITNNITIMGSVLAERELMTVVNKNTKQTYKSKGLSVN